MHIIIDGTDYHSPKVLFEQTEKMKIKLQHLPTYSSNLNHIELLWNVMNEHLRNNGYCATANRFRQKTNHSLYDTLP